MNIIRRLFGARGGASDGEKSGYGKTTIILDGYNDRILLARNLKDHTILVDYLDSLRLQKLRMSI